MLLYVVQTPFADCEVFSTEGRLVPLAFAQFFKDFATDKRPPPGHHGRAGTSRDLITHLLSHQSIDFGAMIFVIGQTLVHLGARQVWKAPADVLDARSIDDQTDYVMNADAGSFNDRFPLTDAWKIDQVTVGSSSHELQLIFAGC